MCNQVLSGKHLIACPEYRYLHAIKVNQLFKEHLRSVRYSPMKRPPISIWVEKLLRVAFNEANPGAILPDTDGPKYWVQMIDVSGHAAWAGYISHDTLEQLVIRFSSAQGFESRPVTETRAKKFLNSFGPHFLKCLFTLLHTYECRGTVSRKGTRCQGPQGLAAVPHRVLCNTRFWWKPCQEVIDIATDILGATCDLSANALDLNWKFKSFRNVNTCNLPFGAMRGPASPGTCFFAFASRRLGEPPSLLTVTGYLGQAMFAAHSRLVLFLAVNPEVRAELDRIPGLAVIIVFPRGTIRLAPPTVWRYENAKSASKFSFALCVWQKPGFCEMYEESRKYIERRLLPQGARRVSKDAVIDLDAFDRLWMGIGSCIPFSFPDTRAQSIFLLTAEEEKLFAKCGITGKELSRLMRTMRRGMLDFMLSKWLPRCPDKIQRIRRIHTKKAFAPKGRAHDGSSMM